MTKNKQDKNRTLSDQQLKDMTLDDKIDAMYEFPSVEDRDEASQIAWHLMCTFLELVDLHDFDALGIIGHAFKCKEEFAELDENQLDENES